MKPLVAYLESIGLSKTESQLYLAGLKTPLSVDDLIRGTAIKRSTAYHAMETLQLKGLVSSHRSDGRLIFTMSAPGRIASYLDNQSSEIERKQVELDRLLSAFPSPAMPKDSSCQVEYYESIEGVKKVIDIALECKRPEWQIIAPKQNFFSEYDQDYARYYLTKRRAHRIKAKTLWETSMQGSGSGKLTLRDIISRNPRYLPVKYRGRFTAVIIIFDDKIAYISSLKNTGSLLIQSPDFSSTMRVMFDSLWDASKDII